MTKPEDIPQDVWEAAWEAMPLVYRKLYASKPIYMAQHLAIARAIMAEREACALFIEQRDGLIPERQEIAAAIRNRGGSNA
jgi:hypothetical protein